MIEVLELERTSVGIGGKKLVDVVLGVQNRSRCCNIAHLAIHLIDLITRLIKERENPARVVLVALAESEQELPMPEYQTVSLVEPKPGTDPVEIERLQSFEVERSKEDNPVHTRPKVLSLCRFGREYLVFVRDARS